jgi:hypothetical protein
MVSSIGWRYQSRSICFSPGFREKNSAFDQAQEKESSAESLVRSNFEIAATYSQSLLWENEDRTFQLASFPPSSAVMMTLQVLRQS